MIEETLVLFKNIRRGNYRGTLKEYQQFGGFEGFKKAVTSMKREEVIVLVKDSGLKGRGGAGFSTGLKWSFMANIPNKERYIVCNADEGEPGTFKDRELMLKDPHMFLEGMMIACYAVGCRRGYIYVRGEYYASIHRLNEAISELKQEKLLCDSIYGTNYSLDLVVHPGAGSYICGEETALLDSLEGKRGQPRFKPPFPAVSGFDDSPTSVNNVETLTNLPFILTKGVEAFKANGSENNAGTRIVCLSGAIKAPGAYEVKMGTSLKQIIMVLGKGMLPGKTLKAVIPGGSSTPLLLPDELDFPYDYDQCGKRKTMMGSCGIIVIDDSIDIPKFLLRLVKFYNHESCGQCTPCREGLNWVRIMLRDLICGKYDEHGIDTIYRVSGNIMGNTLCALGDAGAMPVRSYIEKFRNEFVAYTS